MLDLARTFFIVDGRSDRDAIKNKLQKEFPTSSSPSFAVIDCNGKNVSPTGYANKAIAPILYAGRSRFCNIICVFDREQRAITAEKLAQEILDEINSKLNNFHINIELYTCCPDIMFENWIIADIARIKTKKYINCTFKQENFDGKNGGAILKKIVTSQYKKTTHAADLFKCINIQTARKNSPSFNAFCNILQLSPP